MPVEFPLEMSDNSSAQSDPPLIREMNLVVKSLSFPPLAQLMDFKLVLIAKVVKVSPLFYSKPVVAGGELAITVIKLFDPLVEIHDLIQSVCYRGIPRVIPL